jgi:hypothetical protein
MMCRCSAEKRGSAAAQIPQNLRKGGSSYPRKGGSSYLRKGGSSWATQHLRNAAAAAAQRSGSAMEEGGVAYHLCWKRTLKKRGPFMDTFKTIYYSPNAYSSISFENQRTAHGPHKSF